MRTGASRSCRRLCARLERTKRKNDMLRGTRILEGAEARRYIDLIDTVRRCLHRA